MQTPDDHTLLCEVYLTEEELDTVLLALCDGLGRTLLKRHCRETYRRREIVFASEDNFGDTDEIKKLSDFLKKKR